MGLERFLIARLSFFLLFCIGFIINKVAYEETKISPFILSFCILSAFGMDAGEYPGCGKPSRPDYRFCPCQFTCRHL